MKTANNLLTFKANQLLYLNDEKGNPLRRADLETERQRQLLNQIKGPVEYLTYAMLLRTYFEALDFRNAFSFIYADLNEAKALVTENLSLVTHSAKPYAHIDLTVWEDMVIASSFNEEMEFWKKLTADDAIIGYVWIKNKSIHLFTDRAIIISGEIELASLKLNSLEDVIIQTPITVTKQLEIYCRQSQLNAFIKADEVQVFSLTDCSIHSLIDAESILIKSSHLNHQGRIIAQKHMMLLAENMAINGSLKAPVGGLSLIAVTIAFNSQIHGESSVQLTGLQIDQEEKAAVYTRQLQVSGHQITLKGRSVVDGDAQFIASGSPGVLETKNTAELLITGNLLHEGRWINRFEGFLKQVESSVLRSAVSEVVFSSDHHLKISGVLQTAHARVILRSGNHLEFSGVIWATSFFTEAFVALKSRSLTFQGNLTADKPVLLQAQEEMLIGGYIQGSQLEIKTEGQLTFNTTDLEAKQVTIHSGGDSKISKNQFIAIKSESLVNWSCHNFYNKGVLDVPKLRLRAERLIKFSRVSKMIGQEHLYEATYIIGLFNTLSVSDRLSLSSYTSVLFGTLISSDNFTNNALFNLSLSLYLPARLRLSWMGILSVVMAIAQTTLTIIQMVFVHNPAVQLGVMVTRIVLNGIPALYNLFQQARRLNQLQRLASDRFTLLSWLQGVKAILFTMASLVIGGYVASLPHGVSAGPIDPVSILPDSLRDAVNKIDELAANWLSMLPGERNNSLINIDLGAGLGLEQVNSNLVNFSSGFFGFLSSFHSSALQLDPATLDLNVLSAATGVWDYQLGNVVPLPFGSHSYRFQQIYSDPLLPLSQSHMNLVSQTWITSGDQDYSESTVQSDKWIIPYHSNISGVQSHFTVDQVEQNGKLVLVSSVLKAKLFTEKTHSVEQWSKSHFQIDQFQQAGIGEFWQCSGKIKMYDINKSGAAFYFYSALDIQSWHEAGVTQLFASKASVNDLTMGGLFAAEAQSNLQGHALHVEKDAQLGSRTSDWNFDAFTNEGDSIPDLIEVDDSHNSNHSSHHLSPSDHHSHGFHLEESKPAGLHYTPDHSYSAQLTENGSIIYSSPNEIKLKDIEIVSVSAIGYHAPKIVMGGHNRGGSLMVFADEKITMNHADNQFSGQLSLDAKNITMDGGKTLAGSLKCHGDNLVLKNGAKAVAQGDVIVDMKEEVKLEGRQSTVTEVKNHHHCLIFTDKTTTTKTIFDNALLGSADKNVQVEAEKITLISGDVEAKGDIDLNAVQQIKINAKVGHDSLDQSHSNLLGHDKSHEDIDVAASSHIDAGRKVTLQAGENIYNQSGEISGDEIQESVSAANGQIINESLILNHHASESHSGFSFQGIAGMAGRPSVEKYIHQLPLMGEKVGDLESDVKLINDVTDFTDELIRASRHRQMIQELQQIFSLQGGLSLRPALSWTLGTQHSQYQSQFVGPGSLTARRLLIVNAAGQAAFLNNYAVDAENADIDVGELKSSAAELHESNSDYNFQIGFSMRLLNPQGVNFNYDASHQDKIDYEGGAIHFNHADIHAGLVSDYGNPIKADHLIGHVDHLVSSSPLAEQHSWESHVGVSSGGSLSISVDREDSQHVSHSSLWLTDDNDDFSVDRADLIGETLPDNIHPGEAHLVPLYDISERHGFHVSYQPATLFSWAHFDNHKQDEKIQHGGAEDGRIWYQRDSRLEFGVPIYHPGAGREFLDNMSWLKKQWWPKEVVTPVVPSQIYKPELSALHQSVRFGSGYYTSASFTADFPQDFLEINDPQGDRSLFNSVQPSLLAIDSAESAEDEHTRIFLTNHTNFGPLVEIVENDLQEIEKWNHTFQNLFKSAEFKTYLSAAKQKFSLKEVVFHDFIENVFDPFASALYDRSSYFYPLYSLGDGSQILSPEILVQPDIFKMIEQTAENIDDYAEHYTKFMTPLRVFYISGIVLEDSYQFAKGEPVLPLIKEEIYSTIAGVTAASASEHLVPLCSEITLGALSGFWKVSLPVSGMIAGSIAGEYLGEHDKNDSMDISLGLAAARQSWQAGVLRDALAVDFKESIMLDYFDEVLSNRSIDSYFNYIDILRNHSTPFGEALIKPLSKDIFELSQIADKYSGLADLPAEFSKYITDEDLNKYAKLMEDSELKPNYNVNGEFFREIIDKHSDFAPANISRLKTIGKSLFVLAAVESFYQLATAEDKLNEAGHLGLTWAAAEAGGYVGALAGSAFCGPFSPLCVAGVALAGGATGVVLTEKAWQQNHRFFNRNAQAVSGEAAHALELLRSELAAVLSQSQELGFR